VSGSPIIQDGKLVGAVTYVLVNDPTRGYGIFIENMLDARALFMGGGICPCFFCLKSYISNNDTIRVLHDTERFFHLF